jgi:hypothetical protein
MTHCVSFWAPIVSAAPLHVTEIYLFCLNTKLFLFGNYFLAAEMQNGIVEKLLTLDDDKGRRKEALEEKRKLRKQLWKSGGFGGQEVADGSLIMPTSIEMSVAADLQMDQFMSGLGSPNNLSHLGTMSANRSRHIIPEHSVTAPGSIKSSTASRISLISDCSSVSRSSVVSKEGRMQPKLAIVYLKDSKAAIEMVITDSCSSTNVASGTRLERRSIDGTLVESLTIDRPDMLARPNSTEVVNLPATSESLP